MAPKKISQKRWVKGAVPTTGILSQAPGSVQRISNMLLTQRGSLITCDGSFTIGVIDSSGGHPHNFPLALGVFNDYTSGVYPFYPALASNQATDSSATEQLFIGYPGTPPTKINFTIATAVHFNVASLSPALLAPGDPQFVGASSASTTYFPSSTSGSVAANVAGAPPNANSSNTLNFSGFTSVPLTPGNSVLMSVTFSGVFSGNGFPSNGFGTLLFSVDGGVTFNPWTPASPILPIPQSFPSTTVNFTVPTSFANLNLLVIQVEALVSNGNRPGACSEALTITAVSAVVTAASTFSPYGGILGQGCPIPEILQFFDTTILILGNGLPPQTVNVTLLGAATASPVTNTFTANYPNWQPTVAWQAGNQISVIIGGVTYLFTATQGGISEAMPPGPPPFSAVLGSTVTDNQVIWRNDGAVSTSPAPRGAAHGIVYAGSLWLANTSPQTTSDQLDGPTVLKMSDTNNPESWNPLNVAFIGRDDGTQITGLASFTIAEAGIAPTGSLIVFKEFTTYQVFGVFGATDFAITLAQTYMGCIGPRTIQFLPGYGISRLTHLGFAIFDGVRDKLISEEIRPYIFGGTEQQADIIGIDFSFCYFSKGVQSTVPPMYFVVAPLLGSNGNMNRVFCYDLVLKAWVLIDLPWPISVLTSVRVGEGKPLLLAARSDTSSVNRLQSGDTQWDGGTGFANSINFSAQLNDVFLEGSSQRAFFRQLTIRGQSLDPTIPATINVTVTFDGQPAVTEFYFIEPQPGSNQFQLDVELMINAQVTHISFTGTGKLLIDSIDWEAVPKQGRKVIG